MLYGLDGAKLKIVRAQEHLDSLSGEIARYLDDDPRILSLKQRSDREWDGDMGVRNPATGLSAIIGDCLHNLACALDYTMWEIAGTYAGRVLKAPPEGADKPYFPMWEKPSKFKKYIGRLNDPREWNYKIPDPVINELEAVQPYQAGYERLGLFRVLVNVDKHRLPLVAKGKIDGPRFIVDIPPGTDPHSAISDAEAKVQTQSTIDVTWDDPSMPREPVLRTIEDFVKLVAKIVPRFDRFVV